MPKANPLTIAMPLPERELSRWSCSLFGDKSEIDVYVESTGQWETVAEVRAVGRFDAEDIATFITEAIAMHSNGVFQTRGANEIFNRVGR